MKKRIYGILLFIWCTVLCGCNVEVPDLTEEQTALITEYATNLLVKHSELSERNLLSETELEQGIIEEAEARERKNKADEIAQAYLSTDGAVEEAASEQKEGNGESAVVIPTETISEFLGESNFEIEYDTYELCNSYPEDADEEVYMAMDATSGYQFCVVKFHVQNLNSDEQYFDMLEKRGRFFLRTSDGEMISSQATMLLNDLSSYRGNISGSTTEQMVLLFEVEEGITQMANAEIIIRTDNGENVFSLA